MRASLFCLFAGAIISVAPAQTVPVDATVWHADVGLNYSRGDYGFNADTEVWLGLLTLTSETPAWRLQAMLPSVTVRGPATVIGGAQGTGLPSRPTTASESGVGDVTLGATYKLGEVFGSTSVDLGAQVKLPTASESRGLGTGEADATFQVDLRQTVGRVTPYASIGYRFLGRSALYPLRNGWTVSTGFVNAISPATSLGAALNWRQRIIRGGDDSAEVMGFFLHQVNERWRVQGYLLAGFTDASPAVGGGFSIGRRF